MSAADELAMTENPNICSRFFRVFPRIPFVFWASMILLVATLFPIFSRFDRLLDRGFPLYEGPDALMAMLPTYAFWLFCVPALLVDLGLIILRWRPYWVCGIVGIILITGCVWINFQVYA